MTFTIDAGSTAFTAGDAFYLALNGAYGAHSGLIVQPNSFSDNIISDSGNSAHGWYDNGSHANLILSQGTYSAPVIDFTGAHVPNSTVMNLAAGQRNCYNSGTDCLIYDGTNHLLDFQNNSFATVFNISDTGSVTAIGNGSFNGVPIGYGVTTGFYMDSTNLALRYPSSAGSVNIQSGATTVVASFNTTSATMYTNLNVNGTTSSNAYHASGVAGVSCSGPPTSSFAVTNGIVTHC
jgi:hypothetical protein